MRSLLAAAFAVVIVVVGAAPAAADAPGPTDYRSEVIDIEPDDGVVSFGFIGGDDIIEMTVEPGHDVVVTGYRGEPYIWVRADGTVLENRRSPTTYLNKDRYGEAALPEQADPAADPEWVEIDDGGSVAWHDHRSHWMSRDRPMGSGPGDQIIEAVIPLVIDGEDVLVTVGAWWDEPAGIWGSLVPILIGSLVAIWFLDRRPGWMGVLGAGTALVVMLVGGVAYISVPAWTNPDPLLWLLPMLSLVAVVVALALRADGEGHPSAGTRDWLMLLGGVLLLWWAFHRYDALRLPILSTDAPWWLDRAVIGATIPISASLCFVALRGRYRDVRRRRALRPA